MAHASALALCLVVALAACGGGDADDRADDPANNVVADCRGGPVGGSPLSVAEALKAHDTGDCSGGTSVSGFLHVDGRIRLCEALGESDPPSCGGPALEVRGLNLGKVAGLSTRPLTDRSVSWTGEPVSLPGDLIEGTLVVRGPLAARGAGTD